MVNTMEMFFSFYTVKIEGIDIIVVKYKTIVDVIKKKNYNIFDYRKIEVMIREIIQLYEIWFKVNSFIIYFFYLQKNNFVFFFMQNYVYYKIYYCKNIIKILFIM